MTLKITSLVLSGFLSISLSSQTVVTDPAVPAKKYVCGTELPPESWDTWFNSKVTEFKETMSTGKTQLTSLTIPVIIHVIHGGQSTGTFPNLSAAQLKSQITVLNKDFSGTGYNVGQLATKGFSLVGAANCLVSFCLAQFDPNGNPLAEPGIERINYITKGWTNPAVPNTNNSFKNLIDGTIKPNSIWDPSLYFNIWVTDINSSNNLLGYATFPGGSGLSGISTALGTASSDGVWCYARSFGNTGTLMSGYEFGRTLTHEVGHWLGLRHIGGDALSPNGDCNATDYCDDTPPQMGGYSGGSNGQNFGYPPYPLNANVCNSVYGDMYMNFMDYTYDATKYLFTPDQGLRIQTAMANGYFRNLLNGSSANLCVGAPTADFGIDSIACLEEPINILNFSNGTPSPTYSWSVKPSTGAVFTPSVNSQNPKITYTDAGTYTITLTITNSVGISSASYEQRALDCTSLKKNAGNPTGFTLYPNPTDGILYIKTTKRLGPDANLTVYNSMGQSLEVKQLEESREGSYLVDLHALPEGIYMVLLSTPENSALQKLMIAR